MENKTLFSIQNEEQIDNLEKPRISFYSTKKRIRGLLALPEVKSDLKSLVKDKHRVEVSEEYDRFYLRVYDGDIPVMCIRRDFDPYFGSDYKGLVALDKRLDNINGSRDRTDDSAKRQLGRGFLHGIATPFSISNELKHLRKSFDNGYNYNIDAGVFSQTATTVIIPLLVATSLPIESTLVYLGTAAATNVGINVGRYLKDFRKRAKEQE